MEMQDRRQTKQLRQTTGDGPTRATGNGLTADHMGLAWGAGPRWGGAAAAIVAAGYGIAAAIPAVRQAVTIHRCPGRPPWSKALVVIPLVTVIPEEFAFRGVLWGLLRRQSGQRVATGVSSALFGLWHVLPAMAGCGPTSRWRASGGRSRGNGPAGGRHRVVHGARRGAVL